MELEKPESQILLGGSLAKRVTPLSNQKRNRAKNQHPL